MNKRKNMEEVEYNEYVQKRKTKTSWKYNWQYWTNWFS